MGWKSRDALAFKSTALAYVGTFAIVGKPFDYYWGWMYMPLLVLGFAWSPIALKDLMNRAK